jgi:hypothetical protein
MELIALTIGIVLRIAVPLGLLLWGCDRLRAWDQRRSAA